ncbi:MAG: hypothetical protein ACLPP2_02800 [Thermoplasmata archaeon]
MVEFALLRRSVVVQVVTGPDVPEVSVVLDSGTITARVPNPIGGTVVAGTINAGTVAATEIVGAVQLAALVHSGEVTPDDAARRIAGPAQLGPESGDTGSGGGSL